MRILSTVANAPVRGPRRGEIVFAGERGGEGAGDSATTRSVMVRCFDKTEHRGKSLSRNSAARLAQPYDNLSSALMLPPAIAASADSPSSADATRSIGS